MDVLEFLKSMFKNFAVYGLFLAFALTIIEYINKSSNYIALYAFLSASFFIINLCQYYVINSTNKKLSSTFLLHTIIGGIIWVVYSIVMYILYLNKITGLENIILMLVFIIIVTLVYYILFIKNNILERFVTK